MTKLRATLLTPLSGSLAPFGQACATGLLLWAQHASQLPTPWTGVELAIQDIGSSRGAQMDASIRAALNTRPDVLFGPYGSNTMLAAARATQQVIWNHGGATSQLAHPTFPHVINILSPASTYFVGVLQAVRTSDPDAETVSLFHSNSGFGKDIARGAIQAANDLKFALQAIPFEPRHARETTTRIPQAHILLVAGNFEDELAVAPILLRRPWRAAAFVGAGVEEVLAPLGTRREGLLGPAQWLASAAPIPDEGPDANWFITHYRKVANADGDPPYPAVQAFAAGLLAARTLYTTGSLDDTDLLTAAAQLTCTTLYGAFQLDPHSGLQSGHQILIVQWQQGKRRVVWPPQQAEATLQSGSKGLSH
ncbi:ABC transporter substrate-binding protein [Dictyobacter arantiisoli]|uniref:Uncharacterized protein n=1 Tax=Dictyobacter arantiisoli TaxID=2014874 RepID=A0A5A5TFG4_9CHLR|nr:ABC transporter substrate-binding protein [Dictyobacter arantiisoli]GCF10310.1 hypothetical protein KDI_38740 [Dictyobacter arantiisoli]